MTGLLLRCGLRVQQARIRESMSRVDPEGVLLRALELNVIRRRSYQVQGPLSLWHINGDHKLIRYAEYQLATEVVMFQQQTKTNNKWLLHKENGPKPSSLRSMACFSLAIISPHLIEFLCSKFKTFYSASEKGYRFLFL